MYNVDDVMRPDAVAEDIRFLFACLSTIALICWVPDGKSIGWVFLYALKVSYFVRIRGELKAASNGL